MAPPPIRERKDVLATVAVDDGDERHAASEYTRRRWVRPIHLKDTRLSRALHANFSRRRIVRRAQQKPPRPRLPHSALIAPTSRPFSTSPTSALIFLHQRLRHRGEIRLHGCVRNWPQETIIARRA